MKKSKRLLSFLLSAVMLLGVFAVTSFAEDAAEEETVDGTANVTIKTDSDFAKAGDVITVTINVATDYNATTMRWPVLFSSQFFELVEGSETVTEDLANFGGSAKKTEISNNAEFTTDYTAEDYDSVVIQWIGFSSETGAVPYNKPEGMDCFAFQLKVKEDVVAGSSGDIVVGNASLFYKQMIKPGVETPSLSDLVQGNITFTWTNASVSFPVPEILPVEGTSTVIDKENKLIRGLDLNVVENIDAYAYATGVSKLVVTPSQGDRIGTGTKVELVLGEEVLETYTVVIAGDVNGDALVDATDYVWLDLAEAYETSLDGASLLAADLTGDGAVDAADKIALDSYLIFAGEINQAEGKYTAA